MGDQASKPQDEQAILQKIEHVRGQGEKLSKGFSSRIEKMTKDCTEALKDKTAAGDGQLSFISLRVDCMSEILGNLTLKLEDAFGHISSSGASPPRVSVMKKSYTEVMERIEKIEGTSAKAEALSKQNENSLLKAKHDTAKVEELSQKNEHALLQAKCDSECQTIKLDKLQSKVVDLENMHGEVLKVESRLIKTEQKYLEIKKEIVNLQRGFPTSSNRSSDRPTGEPTDTEDIRKVWYEIEASSQRIKTLEEDIGSLRDELKESGRKAKAVEDSINIMHINNLDMTNDTKSLSKKLAAVTRTQTDFTARLFEFENETLMKSEMIEDKMSHLQHLKNLLNKIKTSNDGQPKLKDTVEKTRTQLQSVDSELSGIKFQLTVMGRPKVGFTAQLQNVSTITPGVNGVQLKKMTVVQTNIGNCYHPQQSHFIAPHPGLYCFCVKVELGTFYDEYTESFHVQIMSKFADTEACLEYDIPINAAYSTICTLQLEADERVFLKVIGKTGKTVKINNTTSFSGWAIEYY